MMTVRPPSVMFAVPVMALRRETLFPESCYVLATGLNRSQKGREKERGSLKVEMCDGHVRCIRLAIHLRGIR